MATCIAKIIFLIALLDSSIIFCNTFELPFQNFPGESIIKQVLGDDIPNCFDDIEKLEQDDFLTKIKEADHNEDIKLNVTQLITKYGYKVESYLVETEDGYKLTIYRMFKKGKKPGTPVLLMHGLLSSAADLLTLGPGKAIPYVLADQGYDVWLGNARGTTKDSRGHRCLDSEKDEKQYWSFSWHEIGYYDLPAIIDFALKTSGKSKLKYIGHSQGTTSFFVLCSTRPEYNKKISIMVALSAVAWMSHLFSPIIRLVAPGVEVIGEPVLRNLIGFYKLIPSNPLVEILTKIICGETELATLICGNIVYSLCGFSYGQLNATNMPVIFHHTPGGASTRQLLHYAQGITSGKFQQYDHGLEQNLEMYGSECPPHYPVDKIKVPIAIVYRKTGDWFAGYKDVLKLRDTLPNVVDFYEVPCPHFCHTDFVWGKDAKTLVYDRILHLFKKY